MMSDAAGTPLSQESASTPEPHQGEPPLSVTGAVVRVPGGVADGTAGARAEDLGLGLVLDGSRPSASEVMDLGSGVLRTVDLRRRLVILDWVAKGTLETVSRLARNTSEVASLSSSGGSATASVDRVAFPLALQVLRRLGFDPFTRPTLLRIGFRDLCRDLDPHEGQAVRVLVGSGRLARLHLDCDNVAVVVRTASRSRNESLEAALAEAFLGSPLRRFIPFGPSGSLAYRISLPTPASLGELRELLETVREGTLSVIARFEPGRWRSLNDLLSTFGAPDTLARLAGRERQARALPVDHGSDRSGPFTPGAGRVH